MCGAEKEIQTELVCLRGRAFDFLSDDSGCQLPFDVYAGDRCSTLNGTWHKAGHHVGGVSSLCQGPLQHTNINTLTWGDINSDLET